MKQKISITINSRILRDVDSIVDNLFIRNRSQAVEYLINESIKNNKIAVILAGESKKSNDDKIRNRFALKIDHLTIVEREVKCLKENGFKKIYIIADHQALTKIFNILGDGSNFNVSIEYIEEETQEGVASALKLLRGKIKKTFLVVYSDTLLENLHIKDLWNKHLKEKMVATLFLANGIFPNSKTAYAHVGLEGDKIVSFIEKPSPKKLVSSIFFRGIFVAEPELFSYHGKDIEKDVIPELVKRKLVGGFISSEDHLHIHNMEDLVKAKKKLNLMKSK